MVMANFYSYFIFLCIALAPILAFSSDLQISDEPIYSKIFEEQLKSFPYLNENNSKLLIMFSGTPGMGKSTVAEHLENHFHGVRICSDEVRTILKHHQIVDELLVKRYMVWCVKRVFEFYPNHMIILDCSVDRLYDQYIKIIQGQGFDTFLIRMRVERKTVEERIRLRGRSVESLLNGADRSWHDYELFGQNHEPDYIFDNNNDSTTTLLTLIERIEQKLELNCR